MFTDTKYMSAKEKEMVLKQWVRFIKVLKVCDFYDMQGADYGYSPKELDGPFTKRLYNHLSGHCGFIAHYNRLGFLSARFSTPDELRETFDQMVRAFVHEDYRDLHAAMIEELKPWIPAILVSAEECRVRDRS